MAELPLDEDGLVIQDVSTLDVDKLTPLTPEVISRQATINIGTIGHVAHGKSTVVKALTGVSTIRHKAEKERNITIKLGYANAKIYKTEDATDQMAAYSSRGAKTSDTFEEEIEEGRQHLFGGKEKVTWKLQRHVSFVDCPGHDILMATMLNGAAVMDAAMLLVAGNEPCPQPQTEEHLCAVEIMQLRHILILQNKVELVKPDVAKQQRDDIREFVKGTSAEEAPIIPISAVLKYNADLVAQYLCTQIPVPPRDFSSPPEMIILRSFDVNKPGSNVEDLSGGVVGGSLVHGVLRVGQAIEIRPGVVTKVNGEPQCRPIQSHIVSLESEGNNLQYCVPGGLIAIQTQIDPTLTRKDFLIGNVLGMKGLLPNVFREIEIRYSLLRRLLGVKTKDGDNSKIKKLSKEEVIMVNIGSLAVGARVTGMKDDNRAKLELTNPVCAKISDKLAISRRIEKHWRLIGHATITKGTVVKI